MDNTKNTIKLGHFCSTENGLGAAASQAHDSGSTTLMVYTGEPQSYYKRPIRELRIEIGQIMMREYGLTDLVVHAGFLINPASPDQDKQLKAIELLKEEIERAEAVGSKLLVLHPGSYTTSTRDEGISNCIKVLNHTFKELGSTPVTVCLETMAGKGHEIGRSLEELRNILEGVHETYRNNVAVCLDTCHLNDAGYDLTDTTAFLNEVKKTVSLDKVKVLHINDSKNPRGSHKDRHANIDRGTIGLAPIKAIVNHPAFMDIPKILETPNNLFREEIELLTNTTTKSSGT